MALMVQCPKCGKAVFQADIHYGPDHIDLCRGPAVSERNPDSGREPPRFTPRRVGDPEPPKEPKPKCAAPDCTRVVYKSVVCKKHWHELPLELRLRRAMDAMTAQVSATADSDMEILGLL